MKQSLIQRILAVVLTLILGISVLGNVIAMENVTMVNNALGVTPFKVEVDPNADKNDSEYYKSDFDKLEDLVKAAVNEALRKGEEAREAAMGKMAPGMGGLF